MNTFLKFYNALGSNKSQKFFRFLLLVIIAGLITMSVLNIGYSKEKGIYWKPLDISINKIK